MAPPARSSARSASTGFSRAGRHYRRAGSRGAGRLVARKRALLTGFHPPRRERRGGWQGGGSPAAGIAAVMETRSRSRRLWRLPRILPGRYFLCTVTLDGSGVRPKEERPQREERGLPFDRVNEFDWSTVIFFEDSRVDYGELRLLMFGHLGGRLHAAVVTPRDDDLRVISLRRANEKEVRLYEKEVDDPAERPDEDNPEWTRAMFRKARPASEVLPKYIGQRATDELMRRKPGRPPSEVKRVPETIRVAEDVLDAYKSTGTNWRQLVEKTLRDHMPGRK